jgi:hypothetical protein
MTTYTIKPLEWSESNQTLRGIKAFVAETPLWKYKVINCNTNWSWSCSQYGTGNILDGWDVNGEESAYESCEAHWRSVMEKCLTKVN